MSPDRCLHGGGLKLVADRPATGEPVSATLFGFGDKPYRGNTIVRSEDNITVILGDDVLSDLVQFLPAGGSSVVLTNYARLAAAEQDDRDDLIAALAGAIARAPRPDWPDGVQRTPSIFVYFGQFVAHDLSRLYSVSANKVINLNSGMLDLNTVFWSTRQPPPADLAASYANAEVESQDDIAVGRTSAFEREYADLPRRPDGSPLMPDCRSDANVFLAQLHVALNRRYIRLSRSGAPDVASTMLRDIHEITLYDFLPRIVDRDTWNDVVAHGRKIVFPGSGAPASFEVPIEFAAALFRFGHPMVQDSYLWSRTGPGQKQVARLLANTGAGDSLVQTGPHRHLVLAYDWPATWSDSDRPDAANVASPIAAALAPDLTRIDPAHVTGATEPSNLALLTLLRGKQVELPSAQSLWNAHSAALPGAPLTQAQLTAGLPDEMIRILLEPHPNGALWERTPLWFYTLREAQVFHQGTRLGPLAGRIVMETLHAAIMAASCGGMPEQTGMTLAGLLAEDGPLTANATTAFNEGRE